MPHWSRPRPFLRAQRHAEAGGGITVESRHPTLHFRQTKLRQACPVLAGFLNGDGSWKTIIKTRVRPSGRRAEWPTPLPSGVGRTTTSQPHWRCRPISRLRRWECEVGFGGHVAVSLPGTRNEDGIERRALPLHSVIFWKASACLTEYAARCNGSAKQSNFKRNRTGAPRSQMASGAST